MTAISYRTPICWELLPSILVVAEREGGHVCVHRIALSWLCFVVELIP